MLTSTAMSRSAVAYEIDPRDPRAPPQDVWDKLDEAARRRVLGMLPSEIERAEPPEGDAHSLPKHRARETLDEHFRRIGRRIYLASELPVYYPGEPMFAPDLLAVLDVEPHERDHWTVSHEERGLGLVLESHVCGREGKSIICSMRWRGWSAMLASKRLVPRGSSSAGRSTCTPSRSVACLSRSSLSAFGRPCTR